MQTPAQAPRNRQRGITLIELMVVIVVVAVLASIATTSYRKYLIRTNRTEATTALLRIQAAQEKFFLQNNRYADDDELSGTPPSGLGIGATSTPGGFYRLSIENYDEDTGTTYTAVAAATGGQLQDSTQCQTLKIRQDGNRDPSTSTGCWK